MFCTMRLRLSRFRITGNAPQHHLGDHHHAVNQTRRIPFSMHTALGPRQRTTPDGHRANAARKFPAFDALSTLQNWFWHWAQEIGR